MRRKVLIIGNGFDLDLGWKTSFRDFVCSSYWPLKEGDPVSPMGQYLKAQTATDLWYDLEMLLKRYASVGLNNNIPANPQDEQCFHTIRDSLIRFLSEAVQKEIDNEAMAVRVLRAVADNGYFSSIFSFNYTDLTVVAQKSGIRCRFDYEAVHGSLAQKSIILGVDDHAHLREGYSYLRKVFSEHYHSHSIRYALQECDEVVFFGHSLGEMDYPYFADFFEKQSQCTERRNGKHITIFTKDDKSRFQILEQLRRMNGGQTERLQNDNDFKIIMTDKPDEVKLKDFFDHLKIDSRRAHDRKMEHLASMIH